MRVLKNILYKVEIEFVQGNTSLPINGVQYDSRQVLENDVFVAVIGTVSNGHSFIDNAVSNGAVAIVCELLPSKLADGVTYIKVKDSASALAQIASNFYENPSENLKLIGVTGTNGKTTVASLLFGLFKKAGYKVGLISTVKIVIDNQSMESTHTTPDSMTINGVLSEMNSVGVEFCFMEVSSHGIAQKRIDGLHFSGAIFTNLSHDHLDYHKTFKNYRDVKKSFFDKLPRSAFALTNHDDKNGALMFQNTVAKKFSYALKSYADYKAQILENQFNGLLLKINGCEVWSKLIGNFNAYNLIAVYAAAELLGLQSEEILRHISTLNSVNGRFEYFVSSTKIIVVVDYAHTPDALKNVLETLNSIRTKNENLITVVGCGGNRDKDKRPKMAHIASAMSTKVIFTSDNPRDEDPKLILDHMAAGVAPQNFNKTLTVLDRKQAIRVACQLAEAKDIILVAGKGHETYQEIDGIKQEFNDYLITEEILTQLGK